MSHRVAAGADVAWARWQVMQDTRLEFVGPDVELISEEESSNGTSGKYAERWKPPLGFNSPS